MAKASQRQSTDGEESAMVAQKTVAQKTVAEKQKRATALALAGELTIYTAAATLERLNEFLRDRETCELDLSEVTEIDSAGLQLLLWARRTSAERGARFRLVGRSEAIEDVIALLQLEPLFDGNSVGTAVEDPA